MPSTHIRAIPQQEIAGGLQTVPNSATDLTVKDTIIFQIVVANKTGSAATFLVLDKAGSPKTLIPTVSLAANTVMVWNFPDGVLMTGGVRWQAGTASALDAEIFGVYRS